MKRKLKAEWNPYGLEGVCSMGYKTVDEAYDSYIEYWKQEGLITEWITDVFCGRVISIKEMDRKRKLEQL